MDGRYRYGSNTRYLPTGVSPVSQIGSSALVLIVTVVSIFAIQYLYTATTTKSARFISVIDYTASSESGNPIIISQDPKQANSVSLGASVNERTGIEFAYSFFLYVNPTTFSGSDKLYHVFHKGYTSPWPLMGPGVFIRGTTNTMRVVMNTQTNPYAYMDVQNIPVKKWFHVVLNCFSAGLDIYVNGNLSNRLSFKNTMPRQNYENIVVFSPTVRTVPSTIPVLGGSGIQFGGPISGMLSSMKYARYALSINEIKSLMAQGPSKQMPVSTADAPPYNADNWWTSTM